MQLSQTESCLNVLNLSIFNAKFPGYNNAKFTTVLTMIRRPSQLTNPPITSHKFYRKNWPFDRAFNTADRANNVHRPQLEVSIIYLHIDLKIQSNLSYFFQDCLNDCIHQIEETFREASENVNNHIQQMGQTSTNTLPNNANNSSKVINNNQIDSKTTNSAKENTIYTDSSSSGSSEIKSHTPTEVFNVDCYYVT